jgi:hypothetical protein
MYIIDYYKLSEYDEDIRIYLKELLDKIINSGDDCTTLMKHHTITLNTLIEYEILAPEDKFRKAKLSKSRKVKIDKILKNGSK